jgi:hypothetical protein
MAALREHMHKMALTLQDDPISRLFDQPRAVGLQEMVISMDAFSRLEQLSRGENVPKSRLAPRKLSG